MVDFVMGLMVRTFQFALFSAVLAVPLFYFFGETLGRGYMEFALRSLYCAMSCYVVVRMVRLLWDSWRNEI